MDVARKQPRLRHPAASEGAVLIAMLGRRPLRDWAGQLNPSDGLFPGSAGSTVLLFLRES